jgi:hypothetical protein
MGGAIIFTIAFDEQSMREIAQFAGFKIFLTEEVKVAETKLADLIIQKTHDNALARFKTNSPGGLAESFVREDNGPGEVIVGTDKPYGHRLNDGFTGTDSIGRHYDQQPTWFFSDAITEVTDSGEGMGILQEAVYAALGQAGGY